MTKDDRITQTSTLTQKCLAEFLGTLFLVFIGCGAFVTSAYLGHTKGEMTVSGLLMVSLAFGLSISIMVYAVGHISGCHINPVVSLAMACIRKMSWSEAGAYMAAQFLGGLVGALLLPIVFGRSVATPIGYGATDYNAAFANYFTAIIAEAIGTFFLLFVIMATVVDRRVPAGWSGFAIGLTVTIGILAVGLVTGGNFNPARAFGPTIVQLMLGARYPFSHMFVYFIGPAVGAIAGVFAYRSMARAGAPKRVPYRGYEAGD